MSARDGGPAFPTLGDEFMDTPNDGRQPKSAYGMDGAPGMTLRDYFAAKAMAAELAAAGGDDVAARIVGEEANRHGRTVEQQIAWNAYEVADAMLAAREPQP